MGIGYWVMGIGYWVVGSSWVHFTALHFLHDLQGSDCCRGMAGRLLSLLGILWLAELGRCYLPPVRRLNGRLALAAPREPAWSTPTPYSQVTIGVPREVDPNERRVAQSPESAQQLLDAGLRVLVERSAGADAGYPDSEYSRRGAVVTDTVGVWGADIVLKVNPPTEEEVRLLQDRTLISLLYPAQNTALMNLFQSQGSTVFALDCIPRLLSRGQAFDVLSSQANIAGYRAVVEAAHEFGSFFAGQITAAGKVPPARVLVLGAGVAGLAAIAAAKALGAVVSAYDVRPVVKEQVESMGGRFLNVDFVEDGSGEGGYAKEMSAAYKAAEASCMLEWTSQADIIITTGTTSFLTIFYITLHTSTDSWPTCPATSLRGNAVGDEAWVSGGGHGSLGGWRECCFISTQQNRKYRERSQSHRVHKYAISSSVYSF